jgi:hypothetical protein
VIYPAIWVVDDARLPKWPQLALHLLKTAIAMVAVMVCVQSSLLHQEPDHQQSRPILCAHCERAVPGYGFLFGLRCGRSGLPRDPHAANASNRHPSDRRQHHAATYS